MKVLITEAINSAMNAFFDALGNDTYKEQYRETHFNPILIEYKRVGEDYYDRSVNEEIEKKYQSYLETGQFSKSTFNKRLRGLKILEEVVETGRFEWKFKMSNDNTITNFYTDSIDRYIQTRDLNLRNISFEKKTLDKFSNFLIENGIYTYQDITYECIISFIKIVSLVSPGTIDKVATALSKYMRSLVDNNLIFDDISHLIKVNRVKNEKIRKAADVNDIAKILDTVDRNSAMGKRDYAIIVLACTTGIRAGDIINIRISDIDWKNKEIVTIQGKNNSYLKLPLNDNICGALADYVLNGRPCTKSDKLFIRSLAPFQGFNSGVSINNILRRRAMNAGVMVGGKNTIHGIRRMVATEMIKANQSVYTVSQILGHQSLKSTRQYIDLDVEGLRKCTLCFNDVIGDER